jgi:thiamine biosynthesis lipoprotein
VAHTFITMGTVVSLNAPECSRETMQVVEREFHLRDDRFSLYKPESELSQIANGHIALANSSEELRECYARAVEWRRATDGAFTPNRPDGVVDLSGIVKAEAMQAAADVLNSAGVHNWCLNAGGDVLVRGTTIDEGCWSVGVVNPADRGALLATRSLNDERPALATSGSTERGEHIWYSAPSSRDFVHVSVAATDIVTADVLATAIIAGGHASLTDSTAHWPIDVLAVTRDGQIFATPGFLDR